MKNAIKNLVLFIIVAIVFTASVQAQFALGFRAGFNLTNMAVENNGKKVYHGDFKLKFRAGFQFGLVGECAISKIFAIQPGILITTQGARQKFHVTHGSTTLEYEASVNLHYLQIPINTQFKLNFGEIKLLLQASPYLGYAIIGNEKQKTMGDPFNPNGTTNSSKIKFGSRTDELKPFDFGIGTGIGIQINDFQIGLGYNFGMKNLSNMDREVIKNNGITLTLTLLFRE